MRKGNGSRVFLLAACFALLVFSGCQRVSGQTDPASMTIGDYQFRVEETTGDPYNVSILYSLTRLDGETLDDGTHFEDLHSTVSDRSAGGGGYVQYSMSPDGKTLWIEEQWSSANSQPDSVSCVVTLENLVLGAQPNADTVEGVWELSFQVSRTEEAVNVLKRELEVPDTGMENGAYQLQRILLSPVGIHIEMDVPESCVATGAVQSNFTVSILLQDGSLLEALDPHISMTRRNEDSVYQATWETMFESSIEPETVSSLFICNTSIPVSVSS